MQILKEKKTPLINREDFALKINKTDNLLRNALFQPNGTDEFCLVGFGVDMPFLSLLTV